MRWAKGALTIIAGLVLLLQAGTSVAYADEGHRKGAAKSDNKAQVTAKAEERSAAGATVSAGASTQQRAAASSEQKAKVSSEQKAQVSSEHTAKAASESPSGNNGDIKIHAVATAQADHRNQPKPGCTFYIDGFNFDGRSSGEWSIEGQGQTSGTFGSGAWGPSDSAGDWRSKDMTLPSGHYKAAVSQTMANGAANNPPGGEKTKVFKIECGTSTGETRNRNTGGNGNGTIAGSLQGSLTGSRSTGGSRSGTGSKSNGGSGTGTGSASKNGSRSGTGSASAGMASVAGTGTVSAGNSMSLEGVATVSVGNRANGANNADNRSATNNGTANTSALNNGSASNSETNNGTANNSATNNGTANTTINASIVTTAGTTVAGLQTTPMGTGNVNGNAQVGTQTAGQQQVAVLGVETLPSTSTGVVPFMALGGVLMSVGAWLLRKPGRPNS